MCSGLFFLCGNESKQFLSLFCLLCSEKITFCILFYSACHEYAIYRPISFLSVLLVLSSSTLVDFLVHSGSASAVGSKKDHEEPAVGSVSGGGRYDGLVGMFDHKGRKVSPTYYHRSFPGPHHFSVFHLGQVPVSVNSSMCVYMKLHSFQQVNVIWQGVIT